jgi:hypothetical protein
MQEAGEDRRHEVQRLAADLVRLASELVAAPTFTLGVREKVQALVEVDRAGRAVEAARLAVIRSLDGDDLLEVGAVNLAGLLRTRLQTAPGRARADIDAARAADPDALTEGERREERGCLAAMGAALRDGVVSRPHLDVAVRTLDKIPQRLRAGAAAAVDDFFVGVSRSYPPRECENLAAELLDRLDPARTERGFDPEAFTRRRLDMVSDSTGMLVIRGQLDPLTGAQLKAAVEHFAAPDPAAVDGDGTVIGRDERTPSQRRADALGVLARQGVVNAGSRGGEPPRVVVHASVDQLAALEAGRTLGEQTAAGRAWCEQTGFITPDVLERIGCGALFERVLLAPNGAVLSLGRSVRLATPAQRRALALRDRGCVIPGCSRPANQTDAHHVTSWVSGGVTDVDEMVLACGPHHSAIHAGIYRIVMRDGVPWVAMPTSIDPEGRLARNTLHEDMARAREVGRQITFELGLDARPPPSRRH